MDQKTVRANRRELNTKARNLGDLRGEIRLHVVNIIDDDLRDLQILSVELAMYVVTFR